MRVSDAEGPAMDTPEKNQIITPISKFEDSPVFNYINNLSPIKPVKSVHITQTLNALSFSSLPSIFTSPHVSLKESRFLRRHNVSDPLNTQYSSENGKKTGANEKFRSIEHSQKFDDCGSPTARCGIETKCFSQSVCTSTSIVPFGQEISDKGLFESKLPLEGIRHIEENKGGAICDWETLISDASDLLIFSSPDGAVALNSQNFTNDDLSDFQKTQAVGSGEQHERENLSTQPEEDSDLKEIEETQDILTDASMNNCITGATSENMGDEHVPHFQRGMRRRCLVFEIMGGRRQHLDDSSSSGLPVLPHLNDSRMCVLPGIGLHLNAIASTSKDKKVVNHETLASSQESLDKSLGEPSFERGICSSKIEVQAIEEASQASGYIVSEDLNQISPIKKRRRLENGGDTEGCKRCNCKKSKCLKLYCECFAAGIYCVEPCSCQECFNKPIYEDTVLATRKQIESRNPLAFAPKVIRSSDSTAETRDESSKTPASARHKRGCNCKKSGCLKKYCECYQGGVGCSINCRCEACKNVFGRKDGSALIGAESEQEEEETETWENSLVDKTSQRTVIPNEAEQNPDYAIPETPSRFGRSLVQLPFPKGKPPRSSSSSLSIGSSSGLYSSQRFPNPNLLQPQSKFEKQFQLIHEDEMPEILQENISPISGIKTSSPNSKRVSPPHCELGFSPGRRSSRKLILQSIRSFPSLNHNH